MNTKTANYDILVVDSSTLVLDRIDQMLKELDCIGQVLKAHNYREALEIMSKQPFDIVLLDTQLPGTNGFELLAYIKKSFPETKTIILTNQSGNFYRNKVEKIGSDHFIDKSAEFDKIVQIIHDYSVRFEMN